VFRPQSAAAAESPDGRGLHELRPAKFSRAAAGRSATAPAAAAPAIQRRRDYGREHPVAALQ
jgi:hypothetical protein